MLGYVRVNAQELRLREYEYYRALYCGLCRRMGKCTGQCSRMSLSYDFVFLATLRMSILGEKPSVGRVRCMVHPLKKRNAVLASPSLDYCADASALLSYHKLNDDVADEKGFARTKAILLRLLMRSAYKKARGRHGELDEKIGACLQRLSEYEKDAHEYPSADTPAALFGELMAAVFSEGLEGADARIASEMGRAVGHWIYLADAADDFAEDKKRGRFNPYKGLFGETPTATDLENLRVSLTAQLMRGESAMLLIDSYATTELKEILYNIMYLGLPARAEQIVSGMRKSLLPKEEKRES